MDVEPRNLLVSVVAGLGLLSAAGMARAISADVLTISAGASYAGGPVEATISEADEGTAFTATFTLALTSPFAEMPTDLHVFDSFALGSGVHLIHTATGAAPDEVVVQFSWAPDDATDLFKMICAVTVGGLPPGSCLIETTEPQDLTDLIFPASAFPTGAPFHVALQSDMEPVPEPGSLALLGGGLAELLLIQHRRGRLSPSTI